MMKNIQRVRIGNMTTFGAPMMVLMVSIMAVPQARSAVDFVPHANGSYEYNSNLFLLPDEASAQTGTDGVKTLEDRYFNYGGGLDVYGAWGETKLTLNTDFRQYKYDHFTQLDRRDALIGLALDWVATSKLSGTTSFRYDKHLTPFTEFDLAGAVQNNNTSISAVTFTEIDRDLTVAAKYRPVTKWVVEGELSYGNRTVPLRGVTTNVGSYSLEQQRKKVGVGYGATSMVQVGLSYEMTDGEYSRVVVPDFSIRRTEGQVDITFSERTTAQATLGRSTYKQDSVSASATTGSLSLSQVLTGKTKYYLRYDRSFAAYPATGGSQFGETGSFGLSWQALRKVSISGSYGITKLDVDAGLLGAGTFADAHKDKLRSTSVIVAYDMLRWLKLEPYYRHQKRTSDVERFAFDGNIYGINVTLSYPR